MDVAKRIYNTEADYGTMKKLSQYYLVLLLVIFLSLVPLWDLLHPGLPVTHDGQDHVARIANFYQSISEGNIVPRWAANLNWGYGHPILMFLYPLPSYVASLFHAVGFSFVDSTKLVFAVSFIASMLTMYWWAAAAWGVWPGLAAAVLYGFAPYRFVDLYVRGAIGEHMAFVFLPVILWGLYQLARRNRSLCAAISISFGTAALILSHNALSLMFLPLAAAYAVYLFWSDKKREWIFLSKVGVYIGIGFLLTAFFWVPALIEGKYTLRDIVTAGSFDGRFVPWSWFIYSPWDYGLSDKLSKSLGWAQLIAVVASLLVIFRQKKQRTVIASTLTILFMSLFIMTQGSQFIWIHVSLLQKFQFPWRFLSVSVFSTALLGGLVVAVSGKMQKFLSVCLCAVAIMGTVTMWHAKIYKVFPEKFFTGIYEATTDTGESAPIWSVRFMEHTPTAKMSVIDGDADIGSLVRTTTKHSYMVVASAKTRLVENTLYFPGWSVRVDGISVPLEFQDPAYRGLMTFNVLPGVHRVEVTFTDTRLRKISNWVSLGSFVLFILVLGTIPLWRRKK